MKKAIFLSMLILSAFPAVCQDLTISQIKEIAFTEDFILKGAFEEHFQENPSNDYHIRVIGDVFSLEFSMDAISFIGALDNASFPNEFDFKLNNLTPESHMEALVLHAVSKEYPESFRPYLVERAVVVFETPWEETANQLNLNVELIQDRMKDPIVRNKAIESFEFESLFDNQVTRVKFNGERIEVPYFLVFDEIREHINFEGDGCCSFWKCMIKSITNAVNGTPKTIVKGTLKNLIAGKSMEVAIKAAAKGLGPGLAAQFLIDIAKCKTNPNCGGNQGCPPGKICLLTERRHWATTFSSNYSFLDDFSTDCYDCPKINPLIGGFEIDIPDNLFGALNPNEIVSFNQSLINQNLLKGEWTITPRLRRGGEYVGPPLGCSIETTPESEEILYLNFESMASLLLKNPSIESFEIGDEICVDLTPPEEFYNSCRQLGNDTYPNDLCKKIECPRIEAKLVDGYLEIDFDRFDPFFWNEISVHFDVVGEMGNVISEFELNNSFEKITIGPLVIEDCYEIRIDKVIKSPNYVSALPINCYELPPGSNQSVKKVNVSCCDLHQNQLPDIQKLVTRLAECEDSNGNCEDGEIRISIDEIPGKEYEVEFNGQWFPFVDGKSFIDVPKGRQCFKLRIKNDCDLNCVKDFCHSIPCSSTTPFEGDENELTYVNPCVQYSLDIIHPTANGGNGAIQVSYDETLDYVLHWENEEGELEDFQISELDEGTYCFFVENLDCCESGDCCVIEECITLEACKDAGIELPEINYTPSLCNSNSDLSIDPEMINGGVSPYEIEWSNGGSNSSTTIDGQGFYNVVVTDNSGCTAIQWIEVTSPELPSIFDVKIDTDCELEWHEVTIEIFTPESSNAEAVYGINIDIHITSFERFGVPGEFSTFSFPSLPNGEEEVANPDKPWVITPFARNDNTECLGEPSTLDFPDLGFAKKSKLEISNTDPTDCNPFSEYTLTAKCGSTYGCNLVGPSGSVIEHIPYDVEFTLDLSYAVSPKVYELYPLMEDGNFCGNEDARIAASTDENDIMSDIDTQWELNGCNCYKFIPLGISANNLDITWSDEDGEVLSGPYSSNSTYCVSKDGSYCVELSTPFDCVTYCSELEHTVLDIESSSMPTIVDGVSILGNGSLSVTASGGTEPYDFSMVPDQGNQSDNGITFEASALNAGTYCIIITDDNGCSVTEKIEINSECDEIFVINFFLTQTQDGQMSIDQFVLISTSESISAIELDQLVEMNFDLSWSVEGIGVPGNSFSIEIDEQGKYCLTIHHPCGESKKVCNRYIPTCEFIVDMSLDHYHDADHQGSITLFVTQKAEYTYTGPFTIVSESLGIEEVFDNHYNIEDLDSGTYSFVITDRNGCSQSFEADIANCSGVPTFFYINSDVTNSPDEISATISYATPPLNYQGFTIEWTDPNGNIISNFVSEELDDEFGNIYVATSVEDLSIPGKYCLTVTDGCNTKKSYFYRIIDEDDCPTSELVDIEVEGACTNKATITIDLTNYLESLSNALSLHDGDKIQASVYLINDNYEEWLGNLLVFPPHTQDEEFIIMYDLKEYERYFEIEIRTATGCILTIPQDIIYENGDEEFGCNMVGSPNNNWQWDYMSDGNWAEIVRETEDNYDFYNKCECCVYCGGSCMDDDPWHGIIATDDVNNTSGIIGTSLEPCSGNLISKLRCGLESIADQLIPIPNGVVSEIVGEFAGADPEIDGNCLYFCYCLFEAEYNGEVIEVVTQAAHKSMPDEACSGIEEPDPVDPSNCVITVDEFCFEGTIQINENGEECLGEIIGEVSSVTCNDPSIASCPFCTTDECVAYEVFNTGQSAMPAGANDCVTNYDFSCIYDLYCIDQGGNYTPVLDENEIPISFFENVQIDASNVKGLMCYSNVPVADNNNVQIYGLCSDCWVPLATGPNTQCIGDELVALGIPFCTFTDCATPPPVVPPDDPNVNPKTVSASSTGIGNQPTSSTFYTAGGTANANKFFAQANQVICNPLAGYNQCGFNNVYWTTFVNVNGSGQICGSANTFWRSGFCNCPTKPNMNYNIGGYNGNVNNNPVDPDTLVGSNTDRRSANNYLFDFTSQQNDVFVFALDEEGDFVWANSFGGPGDDMGSSAIVNKDGNLVIAGFFENGINFSADPVDMLSSPGTDAFVALFTDDGQYLDSRSNFVDGGFDVKAKAIMADADGNYIVTVTYNSSVDQAAPSSKIIKLGADLSTMWEYDIIHADIQIDPGNLSIDAQNNIYVLGSYASNLPLEDIPVDQRTSLYRRSTLTMMISPTGTLLWSDAFGNLLGDFESTGLDVDLRGGMYISGYYTGAMEVSPTETIGGNDEKTGFIGKYDELGDLLWIFTIGDNANFSINDFASDGNGIMGITGTYEGQVTIANDTLPTTDPPIEQGYFIPIEDLVSDDSNVIEPIELQKEIAKGQLKILKKDVLRVYPNPFNSTINLEIVSEKEAEATCVIYTSRGKEFTQVKISLTEGFNNISIPAENITVDGLYFLAVKFDNGTVKSFPIVKD